MKVDLFDDFFNKYGFKVYDEYGDGKMLTVDTESMLVGLGFTHKVDGKDYVRWDRGREYLGKIYPDQIWIMPGYKRLLLTPKIGSRSGLPWPGVALDYYGNEVKCKDIEAYNASVTPTPTNAEVNGLPGRVPKYVFFLFTSIAETELAKGIKRHLYGEVAPALEQFGMYISDSQHEQEIDSLLVQMKKLQAENIKLRGAPDERFMWSKAYSCRFQPAEIPD